MAEQFAQVSVVFGTRADEGSITNSRIWPPSKQQQSSAIWTSKRGFYVDRARDVVTSLNVPADGVADAIQHAANVIQMHLIEDHMRQQDCADLSLIDSAEDLHWAVMEPADNRAVVSLSGDHVASLNQRSGHREVAVGQSYEDVTT